MIDAYIAINRAADHIERYPLAFNFDVVKFPEHPYDTACALSWIGYFAGYDPKNRHVGYHEVPTAVLGFDRVDWTQYASVSEFYYRVGSCDIRWLRDAHRCAKALRKYAEKYHRPAPVPKPKPVDLPAEVREIFDREFAYV